MTDSWDASNAKLKKAQQTSNWRIIHKAKREPPSRKPPWFDNSHQLAEVSLTGDQNKIVQ